MEGDTQHIGAFEEALDIARGKRMAGLVVADLEHTTPRAGERQDALPFPVNVDWHGVWHIRLRGAK